MVLGLGTGLASTLKLGEDSVKSLLPEYARIKASPKRDIWKTRPDTRLPKSRAGGQGSYLRSLDDLGRSSEV